MSNTTYLCDYCGEPLDGEYVYTIKSMFDAMEGYHAHCLSVFRRQMTMYQTHNAYCHLDNCDLYPMPTKWRDEQMKIGSEA